MGSRSVAITLSAEPEFDQNGDGKTTPYVALSYELSGSDQVITMAWNR